MKTVLAIAGSDSSGGAGIQADIKTISSFGLHALTAITAVTAQNSTSVEYIQPVDVSYQLEAIKKDIIVDGIKIGMLLNGRNCQSVLEVLKEYKGHVVIDPVMISSTGRVLVEGECIRMMESELFKKATLVTPNIKEAQFLLNTAILQNNESIKADYSDEQIEESMKSACQLFFDKYETSILLKGGHSGGDMSTDILYDGIEFSKYSVKRLEALNSHGTGCCLSSAITSLIVKGFPLKDAVEHSKSFISQAIIHGYKLGAGEGPIDPIIHKLSLAGGI